MQSIAQHALHAKHASPGRFATINGADPKPHAPFTQLSLHYIWIILNPKQNKTNKTNKSNYQ